MTTKRRNNTTGSPWLRGAREVAAYLGISERTVYKLMDIGLPSHKPLGNRLYHRDRIDEFILSIGDGRTDVSVSGGVGELLQRMEEDKKKGKGRNQ